MRKLKAFTLVELLVVISIIALLMAILMPSLSKAREQAWRIVCGNNLRTISMGDQMYSEESEDFHLPAYYWNKRLKEDTAHWFQNPLFVKIVDMKGRYNREEDRAGDIAAETMPKDFKCPADKRTVENEGLLKKDDMIQGVSYGMNMMGIRPRGGWAKDIVYALKITQVVRPGEKIHFMDSTWHVVYMDGAEYRRVWDKIGDKMFGLEWDSPAYRHNEGANIAWYDGHVSYWRKEKICPYLPSNDAQVKARQAIWMPIPGREFFKIF